MTIRKVAFCLVVVVVAAIGWQMTHLPRYNSCMLEDVNNDVLMVKLALDNEDWQTIIDMCLSKERKFVGGKLVKSSNAWGFTFKPDTVRVANITAEGLQTTFQQIKDDPDYWFNFSICYVHVTVLTVKEKVF